MPSFSTLVGALLGAASLAASAAVPVSQPFEHVKAKRQSTNATSSSGLEVDLGYEVYEGYSNQTTGINIWRGIRFAAPPTGSLRWQAPQVPAENRSQTIQANAFAPQCPQSSFNAYGRTGASMLSDEDCLFLNVYAPENATNLPVLVWIHGGGYGLGNGQQDMQAIINTNNNSFIAVAIQYRLGAFGFLSSDEVDRFGSVNAGILDQTFALQWVQSYISSFGGDPRSVTISGESAGGGAVMLQTMAYGGTLGTSLFKNAIAASPYLPMQYGYKDWVPSQSYYAFAGLANCMPNTPYGSSSRTIFECLVNQDTDTLQYASFNVSTTGTFGTWGFLPVTDGVFIQDVPSQQLLEKKVNGQNLLVGNNANEGPLFVPQDIDTEADLVAWLELTFPLFSNDDFARILRYYPSSNATDSPSAVDFATTGDSGPTAINVSSVATGQQQRANNIYAETTFVCPSYWMAESYTGGDRTSFRYQYSVPAAQHGADVSGYFGPAAPTQGPAFEAAFMSIWGQFVINDNPSIPTNVAGEGGQAAVNFPQFNVWNPLQVNLNQTGGQEVSSNIVQGVNATVYVGPGLSNEFEVVNAYDWEGGRGQRCDFWRAVAKIVPE
ncbi:carboxylesterase type B [Aureobasidium pullulans]|uniref:Carboxylic ester hydrolase n=1 Tax=Aureobasidium pullulans TaxID=5580 RepID=A0A4S9ENW3_AURPU|nr:carboxylesterase type B [Aureobasidium pullulans]